MADCAALLEYDFMEKFNYCFLEKILSNGTNGLNLDLVENIRFYDVYFSSFQLFIILLNYDRSTAFRTDARLLTLDRMETVIKVFWKK